MLLLTLLLQAEVLPLLLLLLLLVSGPTRRAELPVLLELGLSGSLDCCLAEAAISAALDSVVSFVARPPLLSQIRAASVCKEEPPQH